MLTVYSFHRLRAGQLFLPRCTRFRAIAVRALYVTHFQSWGIRNSEFGVRSSELGNGKTDFFDSCK